MLATSWLRPGALVGADGALVASITDVLGGSTATQATDAQKPVLGTSANGLRILTLTNETMQWPLQATRNNQTIAWWLAFWYRPTSIIGTRALFTVNSQSGGGNVSRINCHQSASSLLINVFDGVGTQARRGITASGVLTNNEWHFLTWMFDGSIVNGDLAVQEAARARIFINASQVPLTYVANLGTLTIPSSLLASTGNAWLFGTAGGGSPVIGNIGPNIWTGGTNPSQAVLTNYMHFEQPLV